MGLKPIKMGVTGDSINTDSGLSHWFNLVSQTEV